MNQTATNTEAMAVEYHWKKFLKRASQMFRNSPSTRTWLLRLLGVLVVLSVVFRMLMLHNTEKHFARTSAHHDLNHIHDRSLNCSRDHSFVDTCVDGVALKYLFRYSGFVAESGEKMFSCFDKTEVIPYDHVNDDFCDCPDGSDEPGTSSCSAVVNSQHFKFVCVGEPKAIFLSMVNDGICDCCDGSDERGLSANPPDCNRACPPSPQIPFRHHGAEGFVHIHTVTMVIGMAVVLHVSCIGVTFWWYFRHQEEKTRRSSRPSRVYLRA
mmetsp:Transcript_262/g.380  ORF Transcript_262/g.380 Transcript_262/m.380 type:complete len:268 (-) Transcript_262:256-1059(-)